MAAPPRKFSHEKKLRSLFASRCHRRGGLQAAAQSGASPGGTIQGREETGGLCRARGDQTLRGRLSGRYDLGRDQATPEAKLPESTEVQRMAREQASEQPGRNERWERGFAEGYVDGFRKVVTGQK